MASITNAMFVSSLSPDVLNRQLQMDGEDVGTLGEFLQVNLIAEGVDHISLGDAQAVVNLPLGGSVLVNICEVKRVA